MRKYLLVAVTVGTLFLVGCGNKPDSAVVQVPSGNNCQENVAYLQQGVDKYKAELGGYPANVQQLLDTVNGKGPFVEKVPECPSGNLYIIDNGTVKEAARQ